MYCTFLHKEETIQFFLISAIFWRCWLALVKITIYLNFFKIKRKSETLFKNHVTSYSTSEGDVSCVGFKSMFIYASQAMLSCASISTTIAIWTIWNDKFEVDCAADDCKQKRYVCMVYTAVYINIGWDLGANINTLLTTKYDMLVTTKEIAITIKFLINDAFLPGKVCQKLKIREETNLTLGTEGTWIWVCEGKNGMKEKVSHHIIESYWIW